MFRSFDNRSDVAIDWILNACTHVEFQWKESKTVQKR